MIPERMKAKANQAHINNNHSQFPSKGFCSITGLMGPNYDNVVEHCQNSPNEVKPNMLIKPI